MKKRQPLTKDVEATVLTQSGRRCAFCFGLHGDLVIKQGQIAHIDRDSTDSTEGNLAFLCLDHHDQYDGRTSQSKGLVESELRIYKRLLIQAIQRQEHQVPRQVRDSGPNSKILEHDGKIFSKGDAILSERDLEDFLELLGSDHSYRREFRLKASELALYFGQTGNQYLTEEIAISSMKFITDLSSLLSFLAQHFFYYPDRQDRQNPQFCMYPDLNIDRNGSGNPASMALYEKRSAELNNLIDLTTASYKAYRRCVKQSLFV